MPVKKGEIQCSSLGMDVQSWSDDGDRLFNQPGELVCVQFLSFNSLGILGMTRKIRRFREAYFEKYNNIWHHGDFVIETDSNSFIVEGGSDCHIKSWGN